MMFFLLIVFGLFSCTSCQIPHQYHFINMRKNWTEAQSFCRAMYTDLATVNNTYEINSLFKTIPGVSYDMYIGLYRSQVFKWHWSLSDNFYSEDRPVFQNWRHGFSDVNQGGCAVMDNNGKWFNDSCDSKRQFVCFNATANEKYILMEENKSWGEAQEHCRTFHTDLANPRNVSENQDIKNTAKKEVWIGLFKDSWLWSDQSNVSFRFWISSQSNSGSRGQDCASVMVNQTGRWNEVRCNISLPFICHGVKSQPTTEPVTLPPTNQIFHTASSASSSSFRPATTQQIQPQNTTERQNTNTQPAQILNTTANNTTGPKQASLRPATTLYIEPQNTTDGQNEITQSTQILHTTANTTGPEQDNLILVQENLTWTEAVSYCRKHHVDLVSIHSEELQNKTARKATQASTSHVWLGLRYTCTFNFWFWIRNREMGCYQNWVPGHGPHGLEECGLSGAMETTGGQRWVGMAGSEKLNFICHTCADVY